MLSNSHPELNIISHILHLYPLNQLAFCFNGGKDCTVLLHLLFTSIKKLHPQSQAQSTPFFKQLKIICVEEPNEFPQLVSFRQQLATEFRFQLVFLKPPMRSSLNDFVTTHSIKAIFSGQRKSDPGAFNLSPIQPSDNGYISFLRVNPILSWSHAEVWRYVRKHNLKTCALYSKGYTSLGSREETVRNPLLVKGGGEYFPAEELENRVEEMKAGRLGDKAERVGRAIKGGRLERGDSIKKALVIKKGDEDFAGRCEESMTKELERMGYDVKVIESESKPIDFFMKIKKDFDFLYFI